jgi:hypothetical protein
VESLSPAHVAWWVGGSGGRARVEIRLTPQVPPRVQTLSFTAVPHPPAVLRAAAEEVARALGEQCPRWPDAVPTAPAFDPVAARRAVLAGAAWAGRCAVGEVTGGDGATGATFRLRGADADLLLTLALDPLGERPAVSQVRLLPAPPDGPRAP